MTIFVSTLPGIHESFPRLQQVADFAELVGFLGPHRAEKAKDATPLFSPGEWPANNPKEKGFVSRIHFGALDYDDVPEDDLAILLARVGQTMPYLFVTSWSHGDETKTSKIKNVLKTRWRTPTAFLMGRDSALRVPAESPAGSLVRGRLVFPLTEPVSAADWPRFWRVLSRMFTHGAATPDANCNDAGRFYYFPAHPNNPPAPPIYISKTTGEPLNTAYILAQAPPPFESALGGLVEAIQYTGGPEPAQYDITRHEVRELINKWARSPVQWKKDLVVALKAVCAGEPYALPGSRDLVTYKIVCTLLEQHPRASAKSIVDLLVPSLTLIGTNTVSFEIEKVVEKINRARSKALRTENEQTQHSLKRDFFFGKRDTGYTEEEIKTFEEQCESKMNKRWIIQKGRSFYIFAGVPDLSDDPTHVVCRHGNYFGPFTSDDVVNAARAILAPAADIGVVCDDLTGKTPRTKSATELVKDYGSVAAKIIVDLTRDFSNYEPEKRTFFEAPCPLRDIQPREHPLIAEWLRAMAGDRYDRLCEWIAGVTLLRDPSSALYLEGAPNTGKTLLACGLARLWGHDGPSNFEDCLGDFNESLIQCPLVFGDEVAPKDNRGRVRTSEIREFIQAKQRPLRRKYQAPAIIKGCIRLVLAANNRELLSSNEQLTVNDIEALVERFFHLETQPAAATLLRDLKASPATRGVIGTWVDQDGIAEHALFLRDTIVVNRNTRLLVSGEASGLSRSLTTRTGLRDHVLHWLVSFLLDPTKVSQSPLRDMIKPYNGHLAVNARILAEHWTTYPVTVGTPAPGRLSAALSGLSLGERVHLTDRAGRPTWYRTIDTENLAGWAEDNGYSTGDTIKTIIEKMSKAVLITDATVN